jgi:hypothetical protein
MNLRFGAGRALLMGASVLMAVSGGALLQPGGAVASGEACHGQGATLVGSPGSELDGTDGPDVVVTNGASITLAGGGNDLVCVTGGSGMQHAEVYGQDGDDLIDASGSEADRSQVYLEAGDDTFIGGPVPDYVFADDWEDSPADAQGADTVSTGGGNDYVETGGSASTPDHDSIDLGTGRDDVALEGPIDPAQPLEGGGGRDGVELDGSTLRHALAVDNAAGQASDAGVPVMSWDGIENFYFGPIGPWQAPSFNGGPGAERVDTNIPLSSVRLGGGDDVVNLELQGRLVDHPSYAGGTGRDSFTLYAGAGDEAHRADLDIPDGRLFFRRDAQASMHARIHGFERTRLSARRLDVRGSARTDEIDWAGCRGVVAGGRGDDLIRGMIPDDVGCGYLGEDNQLVVRGGRGDDRLVGSYMPDILLGGAGHDFANGRSNRDTCVAERTLHCERRP